MALKKKGSPEKLVVAKQSDLDKWREILHRSLSEDFTLVSKPVKKNKK